MEVLHENYSKNELHKIGLLSTKPKLYVCNVDDASVVNGNKHTESFTESVKYENAQIMFVSAEIESDMIDMEEEDKMMFLEDMGLKESGVNRIIKSAYELLNYQTYFPPSCDLGTN